jgi:thiamine biosynthesis lipoprotein
MRQRIKFIQFFDLLIITGLFLMAGCKSQPEYYETRGTKHTSFLVKYEYHKPLDTEIDSLFHVWFSSLNAFDPNSLTSEINNNKETQVDSLFIATFQKASVIYQKSNGFFDVTLGPIIDFWGFGKAGRPENILTEEIDSILAFTGLDKVKISGSHLIKNDPRIRLNFSGLGDGAICDLIAGFLEDKGIQNFLVEIGGEVVGKGINRHGIPWKVGINKPIDDNSGKRNEIGHIVQFQERTALATSGDYRNFYVMHGKKYAHTIDPHTGYPAHSDILSATVIAPDCLTADAFATAFMSMGLKNAKSVLSQNPDLDYLFIMSDDNGNFIYECSEGMKKNLIEF